MLLFVLCLDKNNLVLENITEFQKLIEKNDQSNHNRYLKQVHEKE